MRSAWAVGGPKDCRNEAYVIQPGQSELLLPFMASYRDLDLRLAKYVLSDPLVGPPVYRYVEALKDYPKGDS